MTSFIKLKPVGGTLPHLLNVAHIQQVRSTTRGVRIFWNLSLNGDSESEPITDYDDYDITLDDLVEKLHQLQIEILR